MGVEKLDAVADRGYFNSEEIRACEEAGITVTLPKPMTSNAKAEGRFGKQQKKIKCSARNEDRDCNSNNQDGTSALPLGSLTLS